MDQRKRLIELLRSAPRTDTVYGDIKLTEPVQTLQTIADHLLANGVVAVDVDAVSAPNRPLISQCFGHPLDEIIDMIRAKEEGRIIAPPVKVGDTVYLPWKWQDTSGVAILTVERISITEAGQSIRTDFWSDDEGYWLAYNCGVYKFDNIGKTVFLTKEQAEKALAERSNR